MIKLKELRQSKNLTQQDLADALNANLTENQKPISKMNISNWENGKHSIKPDKARQLADYFGVEVGYLLGYNKGHTRMHELLGNHPKQDEMGIVTLNELLEASSLRFIKDEKILDELQTDSTVAIKFLESMQYKLLLFGSISKDYTNRLEEITNFLIDFYEVAERRKNELSQE